jgi:glycosyltransferase involved in cell wall biosynthesis
MTLPQSTLIDTSDKPLVSMLLIAYRQSDTVHEAIEGALAQTYSPLEIIISDDASGDDTFAHMQAAVADYHGPHKIILSRNEVNMGIGAHLSHLVTISAGELLFVTAGDDVSLPQRCEKVVAAWRASDCKLDLIASALVDIDEGGALHGEIVPSPLQDWHSLDDWVARPPHVVGAAQAWTRRLFERFGALPPGTVAEDLILVFRAIASGGALTLREPLVRYRRGGLSRRVRSMSANEVVQKLLKNNKHALVETEQLLRDAARVNASAVVFANLEAKLARERFIAELFAQRSLADSIRLVLQSSAVPITLRLRLWCYAAIPWVLTPVFALKRLAARGR